MTAVIAIDANVIVRYLTGDDKAQSAAATELFRAAQSGKVRLVVPISVIQETVYVLESIYDLEASLIASKLISLFAIENVRAADGGWVLEALQAYRTKNCDFGDALLCAYAHAEKYAVATFDKEILKKHTEVRSGTPMDWLSEVVKSRGGEQEG
ncbi:MAG TPA: type II toxin-antitoxin system VapC family toxin [Verrucomicrobiae bacterium]|jgi:predicted nucleic-acid-binding protein